MPCLGGVPRDNQIHMPERHLGLVTADDHPLDTVQLDRLVGMIEDHLDVDRLIGAMYEIPGHARQKPLEGAQGDSGPCIGIARDRAFCFYYPENLEMLSANGARLIYFSPLNDHSPPEGLDGLYLGGGYPEMAAGALAANHSMRRAIRGLSDGGMPIYAECGGFMYLCRQLVDRDGRAHAMADCFPYTTRMLPRRKALGYREIELVADTIIGASGDRARGHEFHYSEIDAHGIDAGSEMVYKVASRGGETMPAEGYCRRETLGSYIHLHFSSNPDLARAFIRRCRRYRLKKDGVHETV